MLKDNGILWFGFVLWNVSFMFPIGMKFSFITDVYIEYILLQRSNSNS